MSAISSAGTAVSVNLAVLAMAQKTQEQVAETLVADMAEQMAQLQEVMAVMASGSTLDVMA